MSLDRFIRRSTAVATISVAAAAGVLSFNGLTLLGREAGFGNLAPLLPLAVDGMTLAGSLGVVHAALFKSSALYSWLLVALGVVVSVAGNALPHAGTSTVWVHVIPPVAFALSLEALVATMRRRVVDEQAEVAAEASRLAREQASARRAERGAQPKRPASRPTRSRDPETEQRVHELRATGATLAEISKVTGKPISTLSRWLSAA